MPKLTPIPQIKNSFLSYKPSLMSFKIMKHYKTPWVGLSGVMLKVYLHDTQITSYNLGRIYCGSTQFQHPLRVQPHHLSGSQLQLVPSFIIQQAPWCAILKLTAPHITTPSCPMTGYPISISHKTSNRNTTLASKLFSFETKVIVVSGRGDTSNSTSVWNYSQQTHCTM